MLSVPSPAPVPMLSQLVVTEAMLSMYCPSESKRHGQRQQQGRSMDATLPRAVALSRRAAVVDLGELKSSTILEEQSARTRETAISMHQSTTQHMLHLQLLSELFSTSLN